MFAAAAPVLDAAGGVGGQRQVSKFIDRSRGPA